MTREELIRCPFDKGMRLIELGPSYNPIVSKAEGWQTTIIDHASELDLVNKYKAMGSTSIDRIEKVDYVWQDGPLDKLVPEELRGTFHGLIASHAGEHLPDLIGFLQSASLLLCRSGIVALALPDKRVCFDFFQSLSTTGDLVDAYRQGRTRHQRRTFFNQTAYFTTRNGEGSWARAPGGKEPFQLANSIFHAQKAYDETTENATSPYVDTHAWIFTPKSFELVMLELNLLGHTDWVIRTIETTEQNEFLVWLARGRLEIPESEINAMRLSLLVEIAYESRDIVAQLNSAKSTGARANEASGSWPEPRPTIVVVIPLYNGKRYIEEALTSVLQQSLLPTQIIVVDDGSTDDGEGAAIVQRMALTNPITLLHKANGGQSSARNLGVFESSSDLVAFLDQDDIWYENHLEELIKPFRRRTAPPLGWVYSNLDEINEDGALMARSYLSNLSAKHPKRHVHDCIGHDMFILPSASLVSRKAFEAVGGFDERLCGYEDDDLFLRMFRSGFGNVYLDMPLSKWRIYPGSTSYTRRMTRSRAIYTRKLLELFPDDPKRNRYYARDLIVPRFGEHAIREYNEGIALGQKVMVDEAWAEARFLAMYEKQMMSRLFIHTLKHYRVALAQGDSDAIAAAWSEIAEAAAEMPEAPFRVRAIVKLLYNPRVAKFAYAMRRIGRPVMLWAFAT